MIKNLITTRNCGKIETTEYANGPAMLATSEAVTQEVSAPMRDNHTSSNFPTQSMYRHPRRNLPRSVKATVWWFTNGLCWYCGIPTNPFDNFCIDHVVPLARGGSNELENLVPCCSSCNSEKGTLLVDEWRAKFSDPNYYDAPHTPGESVFAFEEPKYVRPRNHFDFEFSKFMTICEYRDEWGES